MGAWEFSGQKCPRREERLRERLNVLRGRSGYVNGWVSSEGGATSEMVRHVSWSFWGSIFDHYKCPFHFFFSKSQVRKERMVPISRIAPSVAAGWEGGNGLSFSIWLFSRLMDAVVYVYFRKGFLMWTLEQRMYPYFFSKTCINIVWYCIAF